MENEYLSEAVGIPLTQCLAEVVLKQPKDPIEWISHWLYRYMDNEIYFYEKSLYLTDLHRMQLEMEREKELRQQNINALNEQIRTIKVKVGGIVNSMAKLLNDKEKAMRDMLDPLKRKTHDYTSPGGGRIRKPGGYSSYDDDDFEGERYGQRFGPNGERYGSDGTVYGPDGKILYGPNGERYGPDGKMLLGPDGKPLYASPEERFGAGAMRTGPSGEKIAPDGSVYGPDGKLLYGPNGERYGPDGKMLLGPDGKPLYASPEERFGAGAMRIGPNGEKYAPDGSVYGPDGKLLYGPNGERYGPDGKMLLGPDGKPLYASPEDRFGAGAMRIGPNGEKIAPDGSVYGPDGKLLYGPNGERYGPDGKMLLGPDGKPLYASNEERFGPDGEPLFPARSISGFSKDGRYGGRKSEKQTPEQMEAELARMKELGLIGDDVDLEYMMKHKKEFGKLNKLKDLAMFGIELTDEEREYLLNHPEKLEELLAMAKCSGTATWSLDCNIGLICNHSILGQLRGKPPFVPPESPEWWEKQNFVNQNLYDHELYSGLKPNEGPSVLDVRPSKSKRSTLRVERGSKHSTALQ